MEDKLTAAESDEGYSPLEIKLMDMCARSEKREEDLQRRLNKCIMALDYARVEISSLYAKEGVIGSNVLDLVEAALKIK